MLRFSSDSAGAASPSPPPILAMPLPGGLWLAPGLDLPLPMIHLRHAAQALAFIEREARFEGECFNLLDAPMLRGRKLITTVKLQQ